MPGQERFKGFFYMEKILKKIQKQTKQVKGITINQERLEPGEEIKRKIVEYYTQLYRDNRECKSRETSKKDAIMIDEQQKSKFCEEQEAERSIREFNFFNKAKVPDGFDGKMLLKSQKITKTVSRKIAQWLNQGQIPDYIEEGRLILKQSRRKSRQREANLLVDLQMAYNSVWKDKLQQILRKRIVSQKKTQKQLAQLKHYTKATRLSLKKRRQQRDKGQLKEVDYHPCLQYLFARCTILIRRAKVVDQTMQIDSIPR
ncbi:hypothetical protein OXYTRIMIC_436 [Oxytricha trifallax]|uniref:Uncharacterized protein n=1 Tax=Oxytricha trifallax TaxID=1172189 RepID=A0A073IB95_9SPIT|nr:hypothetical protein OXYTRIMIC_436 [Oxytricha trifallax]